MTEPAASERANRFARLRAATDRVPTKWFAGIGTALFLAVTAAFGGLAPVAADDEPALARLAAGDTHTSRQLAITVQRAVLIDELRGSGSFADEEKGERLLVLLIEMENRWNVPLRTFGTEGVMDAVRLDGDDRAATGIVREDDQTFTPWLQPGVPALLVFSWTVPGTAYADGDELKIVLRDSTLQVGQLLYTGDTWGEPSPAAIVTARIEDVGAGAEESQ